MKYSKIWIRLVSGILAILLAAWAGMIWWSSVQQRDVAIEQARSYAQSIHHMTLAGLTGMMITGTVKERAIYLDQIQHTENIKTLRVIRGGAVNRQFGPGAEGESEADPIEQQVMQSAAPYFQVAQKDGGESLRAVIPAVAQENYLGKNCLMCHMVPEGTVLGAVSMEISLDSVNAAVQSFRLKIMAAALVLMIPVAVFVYLFINRSVCIPLQHISRNLDDIADGDGDLTRRLPIVCKDGIGEISHAFNKLMVKLQGTIDEIKDGAEQLLATSTALASTAAQGAASSQMQSQEAYAMAAQAEIMTYSIDGIGNQADEVHGVTARSHELSVQGGEIIHRAVVEMNKITDAVNHSSNIIQELGRQSDQISTIIKVIKEVAEQTNLLALNAAIEAARAGEQGRGFAVVADEVRKLAERTSQSTQEITAMVEMIQAGTKQAISSMVAGVERVSEGAMLANQAGDAINRIKSESQLVVDRVRAISSSLHTQSNTNSENSRMVENIARLTDENSVAFRNTAELTGQLKTLADNLQVVVVRFRT